MFIISEIAPQFGDDLDLAEQMILQSKMAGASAAKVQLYPANLFTENPAEYLKSRELSFEDFKRLKDYGDKVGLPVFATAFTNETLDWCIELKQKYYKIAARSHKENPENCIYFHCVVQYPTLLEEMIIPDFNETIFDGISDHSIGISAALYASANGAKYLEKHFSVSTALQRFNEKAHVGSMNRFELEQISTLSREFELLNEGK